MIRFLDVVFALFGLVVGFPVLVLLWVLGLIDTGSPLFRQERVGRRQKPFVLVKFRTMRPDTASVATHLASASAVTPFGRFLRRSKLDELPQLWNVLKGEMSLVGPRPERKHFTDNLEKDIPFYGQRFLVKPGLTGWAQISFDYAATVEDSMEKLNYELFYIKNMTTTLDLFILIRTVKIVLFGRGSR